MDDLLHCTLQVLDRVERMVCSAEHKSSILCYLHCMEDIIISQRDDDIQDALDDLFPEENLFMLHHQAKKE